MNVKPSNSRISVTAVLCVVLGTMAASAPASPTNTEWGRPNWLFITVTFGMQALIVGVHVLLLRHRIAQKRCGEIRDRATAILGKPCPQTETSDGHRSFGRSPPVRQRIQYVIAGCWEDPVVTRASVWRPAAAARPAAQPGRRHGQAGSGSG